MNIRSWMALTSIGLAAACGPSRPESAPAARETSTKSVRPGEEPLETETLTLEDVQTLPTERAAPPAAGRPCGWSSAWQKPEVPNPLLAGVGGVPMPEKTVDVPVNIPARDSTGQQIVAEIVIGPDGAVVEASIVKAPEPRWPEAEDALLEAVRQWRYEPAKLDGTPISVCSTILMGL